MLVLTNATWLVPDGSFDNGSICVSRGRLELRPGDDTSWAKDAHDCTGLLVMPGLIDSHTHLREPGQAYKEGVDNGTLAALKGGVTTVLDMPNNQPPTSTAVRLDAKRALFAEKSRVNWGLHLQVRARGGLERPRHMVSAKVYMARSSALAPVFAVARLQQVFTRYRRVTIHAEHEGSLVQLRPSEKYGLRHHDLRPRGAVIAALDIIEQALTSLAEGKRPRLVLAHVGTADEVVWLRRMKDAGHDIWGETCPHYLLLTSADYERVGQGLKVNPPLRDEADRQAVLAGLRDGIIDWVATDHAPHSPREKRDVRRPPSGLPGVEWLAPLMIGLVERGELSWPRLAQVTCAAPAVCHGLAGRDGLRDGNFADLTLVSRDPTCWPPMPTITRAAYNPYVEHEACAAVVGTMVGGRWGFLRGRFFDDCRGVEVC